MISNYEAKGNWFAKTRLFKITTNVFFKHIRSYFYNLPTYNFKTLFKFDV